MVWDLDRLYRQPRELEDLIDLADEHGLRARHRHRGRRPEQPTTVRLFARIKGAVAKAEGERKGARQTRWPTSRAAKAGAWSDAARRPFGYTLKGELLEPEAQALRDAYTDVLGGKSLRRVALDFNEAGLLTPNGRRWQSRNVRRTLLNPRYAGGSVHRGKVVATGTWTALVDKDTFNGVVALLSDPERAVCTTFERTWQGVGTYRCGCCGALMKTQYQHRRRVYVCRATPHLLRQAEALDDHVSNAILERLSQPDAKLVIESPTTDIPALQDRRASLVARKDKLGSLFAREIIDGEEYERAATELKARIAAIDGKLADAMRSSPVAAMLASGEDLRQRWEHMSASLRSQVIDELAVVTRPAMSAGAAGGSTRIMWTSNGRRS